jgi:hypothetical protein
LINVGGLYLIKRELGDVINGPIGQVMQFHKNHGVKCIDHRDTPTIEAIAIQFPLAVHKAEKMNDLTCLPSH